MKKKTPLLCAAAAAVSSTFSLLGVVVFVGHVDPSLSRPASGGSHLGGGSWNNNNPFGGQRPSSPYQGQQGPYGPLSGGPYDYQPDGAFPPAPGTRRRVTTPGGGKLGRRRRTPGRSCERVCMCVIIIVLTLSSIHRLCVCLYI